MGREVHRRRQVPQGRAADSRGHRDNRGDDVDDAIASRCLARIGYETPTPEDQKAIWRTLAETSGSKISTAAIDIVSAKFKLSGRDVKNLLKLGGMVASARGTEITAEIIEFVKRFKPTE